MADPRNYTRRTGLSPRVYTYQVDGVTITYDATAANGHASAGNGAVTLSGNGIVALTADADSVEGLLLKVEDDGFCSVQVGGVANFKGGAAAALTAGKKIVGAVGAAAAKGFVREAAYATLAEVAKARGRILDSSDATSVEVDL